MLLLFTIVGNQSDLQETQTLSGNKYKFGKQLWNINNNVLNIAAEVNGAQNLLLPTHSVKFE